MSKAREFYISNNHINTDGTKIALSVEPRPENVNIKGNTTHVIEYSAYAKAVDALKKTSKGLNRYGVPHNEARLAEQTLKELGEIE